MRFIKRKKKKKKVWVYKQRFTSKITKRENRNKLFAEKEEEKNSNRIKRKIKTIKKKKTLRATGIIKNEKLNNKKINTKGKKRRG